MDTLTYALIIGSLFLAGIILFSYVESPRETFNKGINKLKNTGVLKLKKGTKPFLSIPLSGKTNQQNSNNREMDVYVHEY